MERVKSTDIRDYLRCNEPGCSCRRGINVHCPAHSDKHPSLTIKSESGKILLHCHSGCGQDAVIEALRASGLWPLSNGYVRDTVTPSLGLTVETFAREKYLHPDVLKEWGVHTVVTGNIAKVAIPYLGVDGEKTKNVRYRVALQGDEQFKWAQNSKTTLYGLQKLREIHERGWVLLVEGETDTLTGWMREIPTLGIAGKNNWKPQYAEVLKGLDVYLWVEPGAEDLAEDVARSIPEVRLIEAPVGVKDINVALALRLDVAGLVEREKTKSRTVGEVRAAKDESLKKKIARILSSDDPIALIKESMVAGGYGGDVKKPLIVYMALTSRLLRSAHGSMPVHLILLGPSSAGKSFIIKTAKGLFPEAVTEIPAGSPRILIYGDYETEHAGIIFGEADSLPAGEDSPPASAIRSMLQEGHLDYDVVVKNKESGDQTVKRIRKEGPTVLITTAVKPLGPQLMTRMFSLDVPADDEQINNALDQITRNHLRGVKSPSEEQVEYQRYLQHLAPWDVVVPFIEVIRDGIPRKKIPPRILRDFHRLVGFIQSVAILRHGQRDTDSQGRLLADVDDYETVYELVNDLYIDTVSGVTPSVTQVVEAVKTIKTADPETKVGYAALDRELGIHREQVKREVLKAISKGWLVDLETRDRSPRNLILGDPIPEDAGLPTPDAIRHAVTPLTVGESGAEGDIIATIR